MEDAERKPPTEAGLHNEGGAREHGHVVAQVPANVHVVVVGLAAVHADAHEAGADQDSAVVVAYAAQGDFQVLAGLTPQLVAQSAQVAQRRTGGMATPGGLNSGGRGSVAASPWAER